MERIPNIVRVEPKNQPTFRQPLHEPLPGEVEQQVAPSTHQSCRSSRIHRVPKKYGFLISEHNDVLLIEDDEPTNYEEAMSDIDSKRWLETIKSEMDSMYDN